MGNFGLELGGSNPRIRKALFRQFADWQKAIAAVLREGQENGDVDSRTDPDQIARFLISAWEGCLLQMKVSRSAAPFDDFFDLVFEVLTPR
jgi:TetR/AcrR family transcriptional repressor of nem operon